MPIENIPTVCFSIKPSFPVHLIYILILIKVENNTTTTTTTNTITPDESSGVNEIREIKVPEKQEALFHPLRLFVELMNTR